MSKIEFSADLKAVLTRKIVRYAAKEFDCEIGGLEGEFFLDFLAEELGPHFYNQALLDAKAAFEAKLETISEAIYELEKAVKP